MSRKMSNCHENYASSVYLGDFPVKGGLVEDSSNPLACYDTDAGPNQDDGFKPFEAGWVHDPETGETHPDRLLSNGVLLESFCNDEGEWEVGMYWCPGEVDEIAFSNGVHAWECAEIDAYLPLVLSW
ncbi:hypothetical protein GF362_01885 [Candidatus Dojkabacteria bacterium]|nr:hypothetical protein [Candidatus Dojkabacteria bacterium]